MIIVRYSIVPLGWVALSIVLFSCVKFRAVLSRMPSYRVVVFGFVFLK